MATPIPNSSTGGFLQPITSVLDDDALVDFLQGLIVGITGIQGQYVRPRWQAEPPDLPPDSVTWCAFGIVNREADPFDYETHSSNANYGYNTQQRHEVLHLLASFYGPGANGLAALLRDGLQVKQNLEYLTPQNMGLVSSGNLLNVPEQIKEKWYYRSDLSFAIKRQLVREYAILDLASSTVILQTDVPPLTETITVT